MKLIAHVKEIWLYPVKSMMGLSVPQADLYWYGLVGDRRYAFVQNGHTGRFPWLTARELPDLVRYKPSFTDESDLKNSAVQVLSPHEKVENIEDEALRSRLETDFGKPIHLMQLNRGVSDAAPVSIMSASTANHLTAQFVEKGLGDGLDARRFRQNIILETVEDRPYIEDEWNTQALRFGQEMPAAEILFHRQIARCVMINVDPDSAEKNSSVLKSVNQTRKNFVGMYAWPQRLGKVSVGDGVFLLD